MELTMVTRYHIYFAGELLEGHALPDVKAKMAKLFNANEATLAKLFSGDMQMIKRDCDRATAAKYKAAIEKAGAKPVIKVAASEQVAASAQAPASEKNAAPAQAATSSEAPATREPEPTPQTAAEKIAALAAAADVTESTPTSPAATAAKEAPLPSKTPQAANGATASTGNTASRPPDEFDLAEPGSDVLREDERGTIEATDVDTSGLVLDEHTDRLAPQAAPAPAAPDTSHLDVGEVGETIPTLPRHEETLNPDTDNISLAPEGGDLRDCAPPDIPTPDIDLSALDLAPTGSAVLEEQYRKRETATAPPTDHLSLDD